MFTGRSRDTHTHISVLDERRTRMTGSGGLDFDVLIVGSGFGGSVSAMRLTEKGYKVAVLEAGKRWPDEHLPHTSWDVRKFLSAAGAGNVRHPADRVPRRRDRFVRLGRRGRVERLCEHALRSSGEVFRGQGMVRHHQLARRAPAFLRSAAGTMWGYPRSVHGHRRRSLAARDRHRDGPRRSRQGARGSLLRHARRSGRRSLLRR